MRNFCRFLSSLIRSHVWRAHPLLEASEGSSSGSLMVRKTREANAHVEAPAARSVTRTHRGRSFGRIANRTPIARVTAPDSAVARPVMRPRRPFDTVRPCTSLPEIEHSARKIESAASRMTIATPKAAPLSSAAESAISPADAAWPHEPTNHTHFRERCDVTQGLSAACGSIEPDSRIGTKNAVNRAGTPAAVNSHGNTVFVATIWSPIPCKPLAHTNLRALYSS